MKPVGQRHKIIDNQKVGCTLANLRLDWMQEVWPLPDMTMVCRASRP